MDIWFFLVQALNGVQFGVFLFLMAAGLTLVFGIMNLVNLAHGTLFMLGAYFTAAFTGWTGSFLLGAGLAVPATLAVGVVLEIVALRRLYDRDHLDQVLCTFGMILFFNELVRVLFGRAALFVAVPQWMQGFVAIGPEVYPVARLTIVAAGVLVAVFLWWLNARTRIGMLIRAGAANREMVEALGVNIRLLFTLVFGLGAAMAGFAGALAAPILSIESGMGDGILILTFVVIVIGGIGSIRGAFLAAIAVGLVDTLGRAFLPDVLSLVMSSGSTNAAARPLSAMLIYLLMAGVLVFRPQGLFPRAG